MKQSVVGNNGLLSKEEFEAASAQDYDEKSWKPLIDFFWNRYNKRYFLPIKALQDHNDFEIRNNCGFLVASIDCVLIETLEQYYSGKDESLGKLHDPFYSFLEYNERRNYADCDWKMDEEHSTNPQLALGLQVGFCTSGQNYERCMIITCGQITYIED